MTVFGKGTQPWRALSQNWTDGLLHTKGNLRARALECCAPPSPPPSLPQYYSPQQILMYSSLAQPKEFEVVIEPLFRRISRCLTSSHFQVAERSLFLWNNDAIVLLVTQYKEKVLPLVIGALEENAAHHWNSAVHRCVGPGGLGGSWVDQDPTVVLPM